MTTIAPQQSAFEEFVRGRPRTAAAYERAKQVLGGGVLHYIRIMRPFPICIARGSGAHKWDVDGNEYIDYHLGSAALLLGHAHPDVVEAVRGQLERGWHFGEAHEREAEWAEAVRNLVPSCERIRLTNSGTEATSLALRIARAFTGKRKLLRFAGHYHGWADWAVPDVNAEGQLQPAAGIPDQGSDVAIIPANDPEVLARTLEQDPDIGQVILEPSGGSWGTVPLRPGFLQQVREITRRHGRLMIMDEMITGFRWAPNCVQGMLGIQPDLTTMGKIATGAMPGGLVGGRAEIMDVLAVTGEPSRDRARVRHGGTYNGNVLAAVAALATLKQVATGEPTRHAAELAAELREGINAIIRRLEITAVAYGESSTFHIYFGPRPAGARIGESLWVEDAATLKSIPKPLVDTFRWALQLHGVDLMSGTGGVLSAQHTRADIEQTLAAFERALTIVRDAYPELAA